MFSINKNAVFFMFTCFVDFPARFMFYKELMTTNEMQKSANSLDRISVLALKASDLTRRNMGFNS